MQYTFCIATYRRLFPSYYNAQGEQSQHNMTQQDTAPHDAEQWQKETSLHSFHTLKISTAENGKAREEAASSNSTAARRTTWPTTSGFHLELHVM